MIKFQENKFYYYKKEEQKILEMKLHYYWIDKIHQIS